MRREALIRKSPALPRFVPADVQLLRAEARGLLEVHFLALGSEDRRLRFGASLSSAAIANYVAAIDFERDAVFGLFDIDLRLIGVAHMALSNDVAELGISVLLQDRGRGAGQALFARASAHASDLHVPRLFMQCLAENAAMMHIARKAGMSITIAAGDADAYLTIVPSPAGFLRPPNVGNNWAPTTDSCAVRSDYRRRNIE